MRALRVVVVNLDRPPHDPRAHGRLATTLVERGHGVTYLAPFSAFGLGPRGGPVRDPSFVAVTGVDVPLAHSRVARARSVAAATRALQRLAPGADVVIASEPLLVPVLERLRQRHRRLAAVWDVRDDPAPEVPRPEPTALAAPLRARAHAVLARRAERALHVQLADARLGAPFARAHPVVRDVVQVPAERPDGHPLPRVVALGALTRPRGVDELLALGERIAPFAALELVGPAPRVLDAELRAATRGTSVTYHGFVPPRRALESLLGALAGVSLPRPAGCGGAPRTPAPHVDVWSHLAYGLPVVTTPDPASVEAVRDSGGGFVVQHGDVDAAAERLHRLWTDHRLRERTSAAAWDAARGRWDWATEGLDFAARVEDWAGRAPRAA